MWPSSTSRRRLQPHNGFIWNLAPGIRYSTLGGFNPTTGSSGTVVSSSRVWRSDALQPHNGFIWNREIAQLPAARQVASTPQRVHLERVVRFEPLLVHTASTPQRVHLEPRHQPRSESRVGCFNPTTGSSGTSTRRSDRVTRRCFNPTTGSSGTMPESGTYTSLPPAHHLVFPSTRNHPQTPGGSTETAHRPAASVGHTEPPSEHTRSDWRDVLSHCGGSTSSCSSPRMSAQSIGIPLHALLTVS